MQKKSKILVSSLMAVTLSLLSACQNSGSSFSSSNSSIEVSINNSSSKKEEKVYHLVIHIEDKIVNLTFEDGFVDLPNLAKEYKRFAGWGKNQDDKTPFITNDEEISFLQVKSLYKDDADSIDLYAIYADIATVIFVTEKEESFELDSLLMNSASISEPFKEGYKFLGWNTSSTAKDAKFDRKTPINYNSVKDLLDAKHSVKLYPIFEETQASSISLYKYSTAEEMAEIRINTEGGIAIDDKSLIDPTQHKGLRGEIPVYNYVSATVNVDSKGEGYDLVDVGAQVKVRGNYTSTYKKKPIRIKFNSKQKMLGLNSGNKLKSWVLLAEWKDSSLLRNAVANYIGNALVEGDGFYCSDFRFVKVYLNGSYNGVYLLAEQQQIDPLRVNVPESKNETDSPKTGYMLELDGYYTTETELQRFAIDSYGGLTTQTTGFSITNDIMNQAQHDYVAKYVNSIWKVVKNVYDKNKTFYTVNDEGNMVNDSSIKDEETAVSKVIDIDSLVDMYILHEICQDRDIGWSSFYFSIDLSESGNKKLTFTAPWDFDYALGNNNYGSAQKANLANQQKMISEGRLISSGRNYKFANDTKLVDSDFTFTNQNTLYARSNDNAWFTVFKYQPWFWNRVQARWNEAKEAGVFAGTSNMVNYYSDKYASYFNENFTKWTDSMGVKIDQYQPSLVSYFVNERQAAEYLRIWLDARFKGIEIGIQEQVDKYK